MPFLTSPACSLLTVKVRNLYLDFVYIQYFVWKLSSTGLCKILHMFICHPSFLACRDHCGRGQPLFTSLQKPDTSSDFSIFSDCLFSFNPPHSEKWGEKTRRVRDEVLEGSSGFSPFGWPFLYLSDSTLTGNYYLSSAIVCWSAADCSSSNLSTKVLTSSCLLPQLLLLTIAPPTFQKRADQQLLTAPDAAAYCCSSNLSTSVLNSSWYLTDREGNTAHDTCPL